ncbi:MAG TPA: hypothetical protein VGR01_00020 [Burkholderiales bacterium]|jgi:hypothetical protein|nr:hypothetical protein [Burkholderiales bacterium]
MNNFEVTEPILNFPRKAAERWVNAVNVDGKYGHWSYAVAKRPTDVVVC